MANYTREYLTTNGNSYPFGLSGCIEKRVIVVKEPPKARPHVTHSNTRPVQEEVLLEEITKT